MATSKQPKQPPFPHPPLEQGVAQYPTPLVPNYTDKTGGWGFTDQGHIILVEKVSIEKGNFNPQPLDGSVTYTGRDANKWPSSLYLVAENPTEDGEFIYRYWANSRTYSSQNPWNYNISYSFDDPGYPIFSRTYIIKRTDYDAVDILTKDPVFNSVYDGGSYAYMVQQEMQELPDGNPLRSLFVAHKVIYETLPGSEKGSNENKPGLMGTQVVKDQYVLPATGPDSLTFNGSGTSVLQSEVEALSSTKSELKTISTTGPYSLTGSQYDEFFKSTLTLNEQIVAYNATPLTDASSGYGGGANGYLLSSKDDPIDLTKKKRTIVSASDLPPQRVEYKTAGYSTPQLVFSLVVDSQILSTSIPPDIRIRITPVTRAAQSRLTMQKITTSFTYGPPSAPNPSSILSPELKRVAYTGFNINFDLGDALCDPLISYNDGTTHLTNINALLLSGYINGNVTLPLYEYINIPATSISASTYNSYINTWKITSFEQEYWKSGIWVSRQVETYII